MKCRNCGKDIIPIKTMSAGVMISMLLLSIITYGVAIIVYLLYYAFIKRADTCPFCQTKQY